MLQILTVARNCSTPFASSTHRISCFSDAECQPLVRQCFPYISPRRWHAIHGVMRADICRYCLLYLHGGLYVDSDVRMLPGWEPWLQALQGRRTISFAPSPPVLPGRAGGITNYAMYVHPDLRAAFILPLNRTLARAMQWFWAGSWISQRNFLVSQTTGSLMLGQAFPTPSLLPGVCNCFCRHDLRYLSNSCSILHIGGTCRPEEASWSADLTRALVRVECAMQQSFGWSVYQVPIVSISCLLYLACSLLLLAFLWKKQMKKIRKKN